MENKTHYAYAIEENLLGVVIQYLSTKPYQEVKDIIQALSQLPKIEIKEVDRSDSEIINER